MYNNYVNIPLMIFHVRPSFTIEPLKYPRSSNFAPPPSMLKRSPSKSKLIKPTEQPPQIENNGQTIVEQSTERCIYC